MIKLMRRNIYFFNIFTLLYMMILPVTAQAQNTTIMSSPTASGGNVQQDFSAGDAQFRAALEQVVREREMIAALSNSNMAAQKPADSAINTQKQNNTVYRYDGKKNVFDRITPPPRIFHNIDYPY